MEQNDKSAEHGGQHGHEHGPEHSHEHGHKPVHEHEHDHNHGEEPVVTIMVDTKQYKIHRGQHTVAEIKQVAGVPLAYDLEELIEGKLTPLADDSNVTIKGGEVFLSHPKDGGAS